MWRKINYSHEFGQHYNCFLSRYAIFDGAPTLWKIFTVSGKICCQNSLKRAPRPHTHNISIPQSGIQKSFYFFRAFPPLSLLFHVCYCYKANHTRFSSTVFRSLRFLRGTDLRIHVCTLYSMYVNSHFGKMQFLYGTQLFKANGDSL